MTDELIQEILDKEWDMFVKVKNVGGTASCQEDSDTFRKQRGGHFAVWSLDMLHSYLDDLHDALAVGRNLLTEKYAYMMESTDPEGYAAIRDRLPVISVDKIELIDDITAQHLLWAEAVAEQYPGLHSSGRPLYSTTDTMYSTSYETYLRGELATYSVDTLRHYAEHIRESVACGDNLNLLTLEHVVHSYGYQSLDEAEARKHR